MKKKTAPSFSQHKKHQSCSIIILCDSDVEIKVRITQVVIDKNSNFIKKILVFVKKKLEKMY